MRVRAIFWKEVVEMRRMGAWRKRTLFLPAVLALWFGFFSWFLYRIEPMAWAWLIMVFLPALPAILTSYFASESMVGERERHTLETLLASPVDGIELLLGKFLAHLVHLSLFSAGVFVLLWVAAMPGATSFPIPPPTAVLAGVVLFVHLFLFSEAIGLFVGQRARTVASANSLIAPFFVLPFFVFMALPSVTDAAVEENFTAAIAGIVWIVVGIIAFVSLAVALPLGLLIVRKARAERLLA